VQEAINKASSFEASLEDLFANGRSIETGPESRDFLLLLHWSLICDYHKSVTVLLARQLYGGAFALFRPTIEACVRAHVVLIGSEDDLVKIINDKYRTNFKTVGVEIDRAFQLEGVMERFLKDAYDALHSYTHSGAGQLVRRYKGKDLVPDYKKGEIIQLINNVTSALYMVTNLVGNHFRFEAETKKCLALFIEWSEH
jgi:hypothetical protein